MTKPIPAWLLAWLPILMGTGLQTACSVHPCVNAPCLAEPATGSEKPAMPPVDTMHENTLMQDEQPDGDDSQTADLQRSAGSQLPFEALQEAVAELRPMAEAVTARVLSNGCTRSTDFRVEFSQAEGVCLATIVRERPDLCRAASRPVDVTISWELPDDCAVATIRFTNPPLALTPGLFERRLQKE